MSDFLKKHVVSQGYLPFYIRHDGNFPYYLVFFLLRDKIHLTSATIKALEGFLPPQPPFEQDSVPEAHFPGYVHITTQ